jgi:hypothetical protein
MSAGTSISFKATTPSWRRRSAKWLHSATTCAHSARERPAYTALLPEIPIGLLKVPIEPAVVLSNSAVGVSLLIVDVSSCDDLISFASWLSEPIPIPPTAFVGGGGGGQSGAGGQSLLDEGESEGSWIGSAMALCACIGSRGTVRTRSRGGPAGSDSARMNLNGLAGSSGTTAETAESIPLVEPKVEVLGSGGDRTLDSAVSRRALLSSSSHDPVRIAGLKPRLSSGRETGVCPTWAEKAITLSRRDFFFLVPALEPVIRLIPISSSPRMTSGPVDLDICSKV